MRLVFFGNNWIALQVLQFLVESRAEIAALVVHQPARRKFGDELIALARKATIPIYEPEVLTRESQLRALTSGSPVLGVSVMFGHLFAPSVLALFAEGIVNLHPGLLPYNRGASPDVWSIVEATPAGVTLHWVDAGIDTGDIICQRQVPVHPTDTGATLYRRLEEASLELFVQSWPAIAAGRAPRAAQPAGGTAHRTSDLDALDRIDLRRSYRAGELVDILRARTFAPYRGAYFERDGQRIYIRLQLQTEEDLKNDEP